MAKKHKTQKQAAPVKAPTAFDWQKYLPWIMCLAVLACYWTPLTSPSASIQWDAADEFQPGQKYLADELRAGRLPLWTPYIFAGFPFLADPQVGAWYPLNWPFLLLGASPGIFEAENLLHALIACLGAYLLANRLFGNRPAATFAGLSYGLSGFFAAHSSHTPMFQAAAWLPWLLLLYVRALGDRLLRNAALAVLVGGLIILAGHFQTALYCFAALGLFAIARIIAEPHVWKRAAALALAIGAGGALLSAIATLPGLELVSQSVRAGLSALGHSEGFLTAGSLATLIYPDYYGALSGKYSGPADITQYYFYAGILLLPLAAAGLRHRAARLAALCLIVPCAWYAAGHALGLYALIARLPGFGSVRAPVHIWFVAALGLSLLAAAGFPWVTGRWRHRWLPIALLAVVAFDLWYWNAENNPLAWSRNSYAETYGAGEQLFQRAVTASLAPLTRFEAPEHLATFGPLNHPLDMRVETTYGYNPLELASYSDYLAAMRGNPKLKAGLNVARTLDTQRGAVVPYPDGLPRVTVPKELIPVSSDEESRRQLASLDPAQKAIVPAKLAGTRQDPQATAQVAEYTGSRYRVHYRSSSATLLRISASWFPGWRARVDDRPLEVHRIDHALIGVVVPAGEKDLIVEYHSTYLLAGVIVSLLALLGCIAAMR